MKATVAAAESATERNQRAALVLKHSDGIVFENGETGTTFVFYHCVQMIQVSCHFFQSVFFVGGSPLEKDDGFGFFHLN